MSVLAFRHKARGIDVPWERIVDTVIMILVMLIPDDEWDEIVVDQGEVIKKVIRKLLQDEAVRAEADLDWLFNLVGTLLKAVLPAKYHPIIDYVIEQLKKWF